MNPIRVFLDGLTKEQLHEAEVLLLSKEYQSKMPGQYTQLAIDDPQKFFIQTIWTCSSKLGAKKLHRELRAWAILQDRTLLTSEEKLESFVVLATQEVTRINEKHKRSKPVTPEIRYPLKWPSTLAAQIYAPDAFRIDIIRVEREK